MVTTAGFGAASNAKTPPPDLGSGSGGHAPGGAGPRRVTCGFCGLSFAEDRSQLACQACPLSKGCGLLRCPQCGYENAREPAWVTRFKGWVR